MRGTMQYCTVGWVALALGIMGCEFEPPPDKAGNSLTVQVVGEGIGTVSGGGLQCSSGDVGTCRIDVPEGTEVALSRQTGAAAEGSRVTLGAWGGDCASAGTAAQCTLTVDGELVVSASFELEHRLDLAIGAGSTGQGQLTVAPGGFACSSGECSEFFPGGASVMVDAVPASTLDRVTAISGACSSFPCTVRMDGPRVVATSFTRDVCAASTSVCALGRLTACDAAGNYVVHEVPNGGVDGSPATLVMHDYECPLGCHASGTRCNDIAPTNGLIAVLDSTEVSASGIDLVLPRSATAPAGLVVLNTDVFDATTNEISITDADGATFRVPARVIAQANAPEIVAIAVRSFTLRPSRTLEVRGLRALAIVSHFDVYVAGTLDLSAVASEGPRSAPGSHSVATCQGVASAAGVFGGNAGAGRGGKGSDGSVGGESLVASSLEPLKGGCGLQGGVLNSGGGAMQLVSRTRVALASTAHLDVSGGGGITVVSRFPTGGAGGGSIAIEAPAIAIASGARLTGRGGSGAAANMSTTTFTDGFEGTTTGSGAAAVTCSGCGRSGAGATETTAAGDADQTGDIMAAGGGGGVGRCVLRNATGVLSPPAGSLLIERNIAAVATR